MRRECWLGLKFTVLLEWAVKDAKLFLYYLLLHHLATTFCTIMGGKSSWTFAKHYYLRFNAIRIMCLHQTFWPYLCLYLSTHLSIYLSLYIYILLRQHSVSSCLPAWAPRFVLMVVMSSGAVASSSCDGHHTVVRHSPSHRRRDVVVVAPCHRRHTLVIVVSSSSRRHRECRRYTIVIV